MHSPQLLAPALMIEGTFAGCVAGTGAYIFANDKLYLEGTAYGTFDTKTGWKRLGSIRPIPQAVLMVSRLTGARPTRRTGISTRSCLGTFVMFADVAPIGDQPAPTHKITDVGGDAQLQYIGEANALGSAISLNTRS